MSVVVDDARIECDAGPINFKPTVMFQARVFNFGLKNTGLGSVDYKWSIQTLEGAPDTSGTYVVSPQLPRVLPTARPGCLKSTA